LEFGAENLHIKAGLYTVAKIRDLAMVYILILQESDLAILLQALTASYLRGKELRLPIRGVNHGA
jgi:hypothetical protein